MTTTIETPVIRGYKILEQIYSGSRTKVYLAKRQQDSCPVVIKCLATEYPSFNELLQFRNQYVITENLQIPGIIRSLSLEVYGNGYVLIMEDMGGISLQEYIKLLNKQDNSSIETNFLIEFLSIALQILNILHELNQQRIIHKDIKPANILINPETKQVKLIDFSIASLLPRETQEIKNPNVLEGTLAYISPEQTGRMNRGVDYRSDFYSLGVTFYEFLTGELPFKSDDALELVHCHIAKKPPEITKPHPSLGKERGQEIPQVLSDIVMKLMAKNAEERYQSTLGLKYDLEICLRQLKETGNIENFEIAQRDICDRFIIPEKLYGREVEVQELLAAFDRVSVGNSELILVTGFSGIGKTAVVNEVHKPIIKQRGYFIKGKFDQYNRNIPFSAFVQAFRNLMGQLLTENDKTIKQWQQKIIQVLGDNAQVIIDVIPELEKIIGKQAPVPELSGSAAEKRFNLLFQNFIKLFTTKEHPLVIFIDDLQWADFASLKLIKLLINQSDSGYLLLVGAYRDNEVSPTHPLIKILDEIQQMGVVINTITLKNLSHLKINQLVTDTLKCSEDTGYTLSQLIHQKTEGNPFFATQFLKALCEESLIKFNFIEGCWQCDISQIKQYSLSSDVVKFMMLQLCRFPESTQDMLKLAACIGNQFDLETLAIVSEQSQIETASYLWNALQAGLILPQSDVYKFFIGKENQTESQEVTENVTYKFLHDRIQQAAYCLIPEKQKKLTHLKIGQLLLKNTAQVDLDNCIFDIVNQLNIGIEHLHQPSERHQLARLNLIAGKQAKTSTAYNSATSYLRTGIELLPTNPWESDYNLTLSLYNEVTEACYLSGEFDAMEEFIEEVIQKSRSLLEKINVYRIRIQSNISQNKLTEAIATGKQVLQELDIALPEEVTNEDIQHNLIEISQLIGNRKIKDLVDLPQMVDEKQLAIMEIASNLFSVTYLSGSPLYPLLVCLCVKISIQYGNTSASSQTYVAYGLISCIILKNIIQGIQYGDLALQVVSKLDAKENKPEVILIQGLFILPRKSHLKETLPLFQEGYAIALEVGRFELAGHTGQNICLNSFWCSQSLLDVEQIFSNYHHILVKLNQSITANYCRIYWQATLNLLNLADSSTCLSGKALQETKFLAKLESTNNAYGVYIFYLCKLMLCFLFGEIEVAKNHALEARKYIVAGIGFISEPIFYFYESLSDLAHLNSNLEYKSEIFQQVEQNQAQLQQQWASYAPMNYQHKYDLVEAEKCRVLGKRLEAIDLYDRAITGAKENEYLQEEALANELAAKFYLEWGKEKVASGYMQEAYYCYARWGAKAKTDDLETRYPQLLRPILQQRQFNLNPLETIAATGWKVSSSSTRSSTTASTSISDSLDFSSIIKAAQSISSCIELDQLVTNLTQIILENSGAKKIALILPKNQSSENDDWLVKAITTVNYQLIYPKKLQTILNLESIDDCLEIPHTIINYVIHTQQTIVIDNCQTDIPGLIGEYMMKYQPKSVLCMPIINQGHLVGILYLENEITSGIFTFERQQVINFLSSQAAISIENAQLYSNLQQSQLQIVQSEKMSALGNLVAGVAHEMNNPLGFINATLKQAKPTITDITKHLKLYQETFPESGDEIFDHASEIDLDYSLEDLPKMVDAIVMACDRLKNISTSLRTFSRADKDYKVSFNIHDGLDSTILILKHRLKANEKRPAIEVITEYGNLPKVECFPGQLNQVFMNILANAIDALEEFNSNSERSFDEIKANPNKIIIKTSIGNENFKISIADNGKGMSDEVKAKIFDNLFTTKGVGKGTGLGLAIAKQIIQEKHGGKLSCNSVLGEGTEFVLEIPASESPSSI
ncbi:MAG: AAA family ATPase [Cyanobacteria bacterium P01_D01_bin.116]